jgi:hypothetical protein
MPDDELDTTRRVEITPGIGVLRRLVPGVAVEVFVDRRFVADWVEVPY